MTDTTSTTADGGSVDLQANLDAFLALVHQSAEGMGYCPQYEEVLRAAAQQNPDKLEYVEAPQQKVLDVTVKYRVTFPANADVEGQIRTWAEANGKEYVAPVPEYVSRHDRKPDDDLHSSSGYLTDKGAEAYHKRQILAKEFVVATATAGGENVVLRSSTAYDPADVSGEAVGRGRLVCKTAAAA